jgi:hypothetical protein
MLEPLTERTCFSQAVSVVSARACTAELGRGRTPHDAPAAAVENIIAVKIIKRRIGLSTNTNVVGLRLCRS